MSHCPLPLLLILLCCSLGSGGKVLVFPVDGSHWINMKVLVEELHSRGHSITVLRPEDSWYIQDKSPLYTTINIKAMDISEQTMVSLTTKMLDLKNEGALFWTQCSVANEVGGQVNRQVVKVLRDMFDNQALMQTLRETRYDLVLSDPVLGGGVVIAHALGLPLVLEVKISTHGEPRFVIAPSPLSYVPLMMTSLTDKMSFRDRVQNVVHYILGLWYFRGISKIYDSVVHHYFGPDVHYLQLLQSTDIWLVRNDFAFEFPRPTMPNVVYIGGYQCKPSTPLPQHLEDFVQSSGEHGVIIMSLGSMVSQLPDKMVEDFAAAFAKLPQKVIWKYKGRKPTSLCNNTLLVDWLPQNDLLGHPKTKAFVTHGGIHSIQEAIYHGVPLVGLPFMFDQPDNFVRMKSRGVAKVLDLSKVDRESFLGALKEVLYDPSYREKMNQLSRVHRDTPLKPLETAVFWIEFVMRHKGAKHLLTQSFKLSFIEYCCIDVIVLLVVVMVLILVVLFTTMKFLWRLVFYQRKVKKE